MEKNNIKPAEILDLIKRVLDNEVSVDDIEAVVSKGMDLTNLASSAAYCSAYYTRVYLDKKAAIMDALIAQDTKLSPTILNEYVKSKLAKEEQHKIYAERLERQVGRVLDYFRSVMSLYKSEMNNNLNKV
jgi:flagellar biosynthesis component FlhA